MTGPAVAPKFAAWSAPGNPLQIEYSEAVLEEIRQTVVDGYHCVPHGGVETGGILFGTHPENLVRIEAWRPIACEYAKGPSFALSEKEEAALAEALQSWRGDAELALLEPIGWYRAHTRSEIFLSDADLAFFSRFFPQPWQVGLIVRPATLAPTRAGFFLREADGSIHAQSCYREFTLRPVATVPAAVAEPAPAIPEAPPAAAVPEAPLVVVTAPVPPPPSAGNAAGNAASDAAIGPRPAWEFQTYAPGGSIDARWKWYAAILSVLAAGILGFWLLKPSHPGLRLSATDLGGQLRIAWDGAAPPIGHARRGSIRIDDHGVQTLLSLTPADLRSGSVFYARLSGDVVVRLSVDVPGSGPIAETTRFLRPGESGMAAAPRVDAKKPEAQRQPASAPPAPVASARRVIPFRAPGRAPPQPSADIPSIAPPPIENVPAAPPPGMTSVLGPAAAPPAPPRPATAAPARPAIAAPVASGRIIWTGKLARNGRLVVERNRASSGSMSGALPAVAARVSAYPGDLTAAGITLFTADPRYSQPLTEKAGADNGWNPTTYTWDPKRAAGIKVVEQPGPQNGYKLVLESDLPKLSVVVLEWHAAQ